MAPRRLLWFVAVPLGVLAVAALTVAALRPKPDYSAYTEPQGHEFLVQGRPVDALVRPFSHTRPSSEAVTLEFVLNRGTFAPNPSVEDERDGTLTPTLTVSGCQVLPDRKGSAIPTSQPLAAFDWTWSLSGCGAGVQTIALALEFQNADRHNPQVYEYHSQLKVDPSLGDSLDVVLKVVGVVSGVLSACSVAFGLLRRRPSAEAA